MVYGSKCMLFQGSFTGRCKPKKMRHLARDEGLLEGVRFPDLYQRGGVQYPTPHGANPKSVKGGQAKRGGVGVVPGGVSPRACPQVRRCF